MKKLIGITGFLIISQTVQAQTHVEGKILDAENQQALLGATIKILDSYKATSSNENGIFQFDKVNSDDLLVISYIGFQSDTIEAGKISQQSPIELQRKSYQTEEVIVTSTRVGENAPATVSRLGKKEIEKNNLGQDIPFLLQQTPSVVTTSDAGAGIGYTGIRIRGSDASRINVTINGIPLNDAESHGVFWVNTPDLASSLESIQIQRGLGTSTNGAGAFGASLNLQTSDMKTEAFGEINNSIGSFNSRKHTVKFGSGLINNHFAFEGRLSNIQSDGYIDRASADLKSYFLSGGYYGEKTIIKALVFGGREVTYQAWFGTPQSRFEDDREGMITHAQNEGLSDRRTSNLLNAGRTYNFYLYENQVDDYGQDHYQLHFSHEFSSKLTANFALHYTRGEGFFEEFKEDQNLENYNLSPLNFSSDTIRSTDLIRRRWLDNDFYGFTGSVLYQANKELKFNLGGALNNYEGDHFGEVIWAEFASNSFPTSRYYFNQGQKLDGNVYLKTTYHFGDGFQLLADLQYRGISYEVEGVDNDQRQLSVDENFHFFNPKFGINYRYNSQTKFYLLAGIGHREPNRADFVDQAPNTPKSEANKAEQMRNIELGFEHRKNRYFLAANFYLMDYKDQLVNTGQLNDVGAPIRQNVDDSYRTGIEIQAAYSPIKKVTLSANASFSRNKIADFTEVIFDFTNGVEKIEREQGTTDIALSPEVIVNGEISYRPIKHLELALIQRYVGKQFLDNTSNENRKLDPFFVNDFRAQYDVPNKLFKTLKVQLLVNNIWSEDYASNGYTFSYIFGEEITENFVYPQAFRNYLLGLSIGF